MSDIGISIGLEGFQRYQRDLRRVETRTDKTAGKISGSVGKASSSFGGLRSGISSIVPSLGALINPATLAAGAIAGITAGISSFVSAAASIETTRASFDVLTGSAETSRRLLEQLRKEAAATPFELTQYQQAARSLLAFGTGADQVTDTLRRIGDISAGVNAPLTELSEIYGKIQVQGRIFGEDINQLTGRGIPIIGELAKQFGVSADQVKKLVSEGKVGFPQIEAAFKSLTDEGGKFNGLTETLSQTFEGRLSTLKSLFGELKVQFGEVFLPVAKQGLDFLIRAITALNNPTSDLAETFGSVGEVLNDLRSDLSDLGSTIRTSITRAFGDANGELATFGNILKNIVSDALKTIVTRIRFFVAALDSVIEFVGIAVRGFRDLIEVFVRIGRAIGDIVRKFLELVGIDVEKWIGILSGGFGNVKLSIDKAGGAVGLFKEGLLQLLAVSVGTADAIVAPFERIADIFENLSFSNLSDLNKLTVENLAKTSADAFEQGYKNFLLGARFADKFKLPPPKIEPPAGDSVNGIGDAVAGSVTGAIKKIDLDGELKKLFSRLKPLNEFADSIYKSLIPVNNALKETTEGVYLPMLSLTERLQLEQSLLAREIAGVLNISQKSARAFLDWANSMGYANGEALLLSVSLERLKEDIKETLTNTGLNALQNFGDKLGRTLAGTAETAADANARFTESIQGFREAQGQLIKSAIETGDGFNREYRRSLRQLERQFEQSGKRIRGLGSSLGQSFRETFKQLLPDLLTALGAVLIQSAPSLGFPVGLGAAIAGVGLIAAGGFASARMQNAVNSLSGNGANFGSGNFAPAFGSNQQGQNFNTSGLGSQVAKQNFQPVMKFYFDGREITDQVVERMKVEDTLRGL